MRKSTKKAFSILQLRLFFRIKTENTKIKKLIHIKTECLKEIGFKLKEEISLCNNRVATKPEILDKLEFDNFG